LCKSTHGLKSPKIKNIKSKKNEKVKIKKKPQMTSLKLVALFFGLVAIVLMIPILTSDELVVCSVEGSPYKYSFEYVSFGPSFSYSSNENYPSFYWTSISSKSIPAYALSITGTALMGILFFMLLLEIYLSNRLIGVLISAVLICVVAAFSMVMSMLQPVTDITKNLLANGVETSCNLGTGSYLYIGELIAVVFFTVTAAIYIRGKGAFSTV
jgi:hypothetical protein